MLQGIGFNVTPSVIAQDTPRIDSDEKTTPNTCLSSECVTNDPDAFERGFRAGLLTGMEFAYQIAKWLPGQLRTLATKHLDDLKNTHNLS